MDLDSAFKILELEKTTDISAIRRAYRDLAEIWHPDKYAHKPRLAEKAAAKMKEINCAYDVIQEHLRNNRSTFKEGPEDDTEKEEIFDFVDCINCGTTNRVSKNISGQTLKCGKCGKNPNLKESMCQPINRSPAVGVFRPVYVYIAAAALLLLGIISIGNNKRVNEQRYVPQKSVPAQIPSYLSDDRAHERGVESVIGDQTGNIKALQQAIRINPADANAWNNLGTAYVNSGQIAKGNQAYEQAFRITQARP